MNDAAKTKSRPPAGRSAYPTVCTRAFQRPAALHRINVERQTPNVAPLTDFQGLIEPVEDALRAQAERFWLAMEVSAFGSGEL